MLTFLSHKLKFILIFVLVIIGISFVFFGDWSGGAGGPTFAAKIKGQPIALTEYQNSLRASRVAYTLGTGQIPGTSEDFTRALSQQAWTRLMVLSEARAAGLTISPQDLQDAVRKQPLFQDPKTQTFSPETFKRFQDFVLTPQGITLERFLEMMREQLVMDIWLASLQDTAVVQPTEAVNTFRKLYGPVTLDYVRITPASVIGTLQPDEDTLKAFYEKRTERFSLPEQRKVDYVLFKTPANIASQPAEAQAKIRRELGEKAFQFTEPFYTALENGAPLPDFTAQAKAAGLEVVTSPYFARNGFLFSGPTGSSLAQIAFTLTNEKPVSDYIQTAEGFAVLRLKEIQPTAVQPYESVKNEVRKVYLENETQARLQAASENVVLKIRSELAAGKNFAQAAAAAGQKSATLPVFVTATPDAKSPPNPLQNTARFRSMQLEPGQVSDPFPQEADVVILHLAARGEPDAAKQGEILPRIQEQLLQQRRGQVRDEYLTALGKQKGTVLPANLFAQEAN